jgi:crotonobetainyl-CoA:carnitine CoA-transferase CaiB-like acyl-CoA transferase
MGGGMLSGVTVLELGQVIAGTFGGVILADLGAEVIKVEPFSGDTARNPMIAPMDGESAIHLFMNRGKKSIVLDLKNAEALELFYRLVEQADVVLDNFRPGVMARLGIDHDSLKQRNPQIISVSVTGFGETGPARDKAAFDLVVQAYSGHVAITGPPDGAPARVGIPIADISGAIYSCIAVLALLVGRERTGEGRHADVAMLDALVSMLSYDAVDHLNTGRKLTRLGTAHAHMAPWQAFRTGDGYVVVAVRDEKFWQNLCDAIARPDLKEDPRTRDNTARLANREFLDTVIADAFVTRSTAAWLEILDRFDIPNAPVNDIEQVFADPQVQAREMVKTYEHPTVGEVRYPPSPVKFSDWTSPNAPAPMLGEHTIAVLTERLGLSEAEVLALGAEGVVGVWPDPGT